MTTENAPMMSEKEVSEWLGVTKGAVAKWRTDGTGPAYSRMGKLIRYAPADVDAWITARRGVNNG